MGTIYTSHISYVGADRLDITRKSAGPDGILFAPSWRILRPMLTARVIGVEALRWPQYVLDYTREMQISAQTFPRAWQHLRERPEVTLVCYCQLASPPFYCHRVLLAGMLQADGGGDYRGERGALVPPAPTRRPAP